MSGTKQVTGGYAPDRKARTQDGKLQGSERMRGVSDMASYVLHLQRTIGNQAVGRLLAESRQRDSTSRARRLVAGVPPSTTVQRAISIGTEHLPRGLQQSDLEAKLGLTTAEAASLHTLYTDRTVIYTFDSKEHLIAFAQGKSVHPPLRSPVSATDLQVGHELAQDLRFGTIYKPSPNQIPEHASGGHTVPLKELPPSGQGHHWARTQDGATQQSTLWENQLQPPPHQTRIHTFGDPLDPSMMTSQGIHNQGMRVNPTSNPAYLNNVPRSKTTYGDLPSESDQVRGHPLALEQGQKSTDPTSSDTFDNFPLGYTRESDGTKGGFSTFRYNQLERPSINTMQPFNQVNSSLAPQTPMGMGLPEVNTIHTSARQPGGTYTEMEFDNTIDYRPVIGPGKKTHTRLAAHVTKPRSFPYERVHQPGADFEPADRHSNPGYQSPPPTPFISLSDLVDEKPIVTLSGQYHQGEMVIHNGDPWLVRTASYNRVTDKTTCKLARPGTSSFLL